MKTNKIITLIILFVSYVPVYAQSVFDSELKERLENPRRVHIVIDQEYEGFHIEAVLHPDDNDNYVGMATFTFSGKGTLTLLGVATVAAPVSKMNFSFSPLTLHGTLYTPPSRSIGIVTCA